MTFNLANWSQQLINSSSWQISLSAYPVDSIYPGVNGPYNSVGWDFNHSAHISNLAILVQTVFKHKSRPTDSTDRAHTTYLGHLKSDTIPDMTYLNENSKNLSWSEHSIIPTPSLKCATNPYSLCSVLRVSESVTTLTLTAVLTLFLRLSQIWNSTCSTNRSNNIGRRCHRSSPR